MISIKEISWTNFLGYADYTSVISFDDIKGVCLIEGEFDENSNREEGDEKLNGSGKTSIVEAITWGLFGNLTRKQNPGDSVINWNTGKNCKVNIKTHDGYEIVRMRKYNGLTEVLLFKDGNDLTQSTSIPAQNMINDIFKINYNTFTRSRIFGQFNVGFLEESDAKRRKVFEHAMRIDNLQPIVDATKDKIKGVEKDLITLDTKIESLKEELKHTNNHINNLKEKSSNFSDNKKERIDKIKSELKYDLSEINDKISSISDNIKNKQNESRSEINLQKLEQEWKSYNESLTEYNENKEKIAAINDKITKLETEISLKKQEISNKGQFEYQDITYNCDSELINIEKCKNDHHNFEDITKKHSKCLKTHSDLKLAIERAKTRIQQEEEFLNNENEIDSICPTCRNKIHGEQLNQEIEKSKNKIKKYDEIIEQSHSKIDKIEQILSKLDIELQKKFLTVDDANKINTKILKFKKIAEKLSKDIKQLNQKIDELRSLIPDSNERPKPPEMSLSEAKTNNEYINNLNSLISQEKQRIRELKEDAKIKVDKNKKIISEIKNEEDPYSSLIIEQNRLIRKIEEDIASNTKIYNEKKSLKDHLEYIKVSYSNKKKIKAFWINELIPDFNNYLKYYLDFFEIEDNIKFDELLTPKMDRWSYDTHSGGECKRIDLSIMFALSDLQVSNFGSQSNFIILDEVDGRLDPFTINKLTSLLSDDLINRNDGLTNIFVISHRKEMKDRFPHKIKVKNKQGKSYITNNG